MMSMLRPFQALQAGVSIPRLLLPTVLALLVLAPGGRPSWADDLSRFVGTYVGSATVQDAGTEIEKQRDLDIVVSRHGREGLRIDWITVGLVDGRRDVPGVKRWAQTAVFEPSDGKNFMVETGEESLFKERGDMEVVKGDPVRWTRIEDNILHACSFVILEDGRYELQVYQRKLTETGMDILFERIVDGEVVRRVSGSTIRAN